MGHVLQDHVLGNIGLVGPKKKERLAMGTKTTFAAIAVSAKPTTIWGGRMLASTVR
jgi:hypothetical protein